MLWVIPPDLIDTSSEFLASCIGQLPGVTVWELEGGAVAYSLPDVLVRRGIPVNYDAFLERTLPLSRIIKPHMISDPDALDLEIPGSAYWSRMLLKPEETNTRSCRYFKSELTELEPFAFKAYSSFELHMKDLERTKAFLLNWFSIAGKRTLHGEVLSLGNVELTEYFSPPTKRSYPEMGYEVRCSNYVPCTWPWIDLYLRMRQSLPIKERLSVQFFNP